MKARHNFFLPLLPLLMAILTLGGCQKSPINGELDGQWQILSVTPEAPEKVTDENLYMNFSLHVCQLSYRTGGCWQTANLSFDGSSITLNFPYADNELSDKFLKQYGIYRNPVTFEVVELNNKNLVLRDGNVTVSLRKF